MDINEYEQRVGKSRHIEVKIKCEFCGDEKWVRTIRLKKGQGRFCSLKCANNAQKKGKDKLYVGKENAKKTFNKKHQRWDVYWFDPDTLKRKTSTYSRWYWEVFRGEIPPRYRASYKDGNSANIDPENIILISPDEYGIIMSSKLMGRSISLDARKKMSIAHTGTQEWNGFVYDDRYPGFSRKLKELIKIRDEFRCRVCNCNLYKSSRSRIHHIGGDKKNPNPNNLVLLCISCHSLIHSKQIVNEQILAFRSVLKFMI